MSRFGNSIKECLEICKNKIEHDFSERLQTQVEANFIDNNTAKINIFENFQNIMQFVDEKELKIDKFKEAPEVLTIEQTNETKEYFLTFDSLRSNCRVKHKPDFGD